MHAQNLLINQGCNGQAVETVREGLPQLDVVSAFAFVVETVYAIDRGALMITSQ
jgi:hypothetical protein